MYFVDDGLFEFIGEDEVLGLLAGPEGDEVGWDFEHYDVWPGK